MPFSPDQAARICTALAEDGLTLRQIAKQENISAALILKNVANDEAFREQYTRAMELRQECDFEAFGDEIKEEPERGKFGIDPAWVQWKRLQIDTRKWALSKRNPKKYGERIQNEHTGKDGGAIQIVSTIPRPPRDNQEES